MVNIPTKVTTDTLTATEFNQLPDEMEQVVTDSGQTPNSGILDQVSKGIATITSNVDYYTDGGGADAYVLSVIAPNKAPQSYRNGMRVRFRTTNANTGASTVNVVSLGIKNIKLQDGTTDPAAGQIPDDREIELVYDNTSFRLVSSGIELDSTTTLKGLSYLRDKITIANNGVDANNDIDFSAGVFDFDDGSGQDILLALTKQLDASWVAGDGNGGLDTGSKANSTLYHCFAIHNPTTGISDALFSLSPTSPTMPIGYTKKERRGAIKTDGSGNIRTGTFKFRKDGSYRFEYNAMVASYTSSDITTEDTLTPDVPPNAIAILNQTWASTGSGAFFLRVYATSGIDSALGNTNNTLTTGTSMSNGSITSVITDSSNQCKIKANAADGDIFINTIGWEE